MSFVSASKTAAEERDVFVNYGGAYWLNPVPHGTLRPRSACLSMKKSDTIDPFGNPKQPDQPDLFGKSRYCTKKGNGEEAATLQSTGGSDRAGALGTVASGGCPSQGNAGDTAHSNGVGDGLQGPSSQMMHNGTHGDGVVAAANSDKAPYSTEAILHDKLPLHTANPERLILHPGNQTVRIPPTGGSAYNGTVSEPWKLPKAVDNTYLRLAPLYESTTHYQLRTGRHYTEDEAPPHGMTLPFKNSLSKREW